MRLRSALPIALALVVALPGAASAATATTPNACLNSADSVNTYRQQDGEITATSSLVTGAGFPSATDALPGQEVQLSSGDFDFEIPDYLIKDGYAVGLLHRDANTIQVKAWVAIKATNTVEGVKIIGPVTTEATTTILVDPLDDGYAGHTPPVYDKPVLPQTSWTATGGDVAFSQADPGAIGTLPLNQGGGQRSVVGSMVVQMFFNGGTVVNSVFDCQPGEVISDEYEGVGATFLPGAASVVDTETGTQNATCLNEVGRTAGRELDVAKLALTADPFPTGYVEGSPYTLTGTRAKITLSPETVANLGAATDGGNPLLVADEVYPVSVWVTLAGANTTQGTQTVKVDTTYALHETSPGTWEAEEITVDLPDTTWNPNGGGGLRFTAAPAGSMPPQAFVGPVEGPGGPVVTTSYDANPYGSVVLRAGTEANALTLDCAQSLITVTNPSIAFSNRGRIAAPQGSLGRYEIKTAAFRPALTEQPPIAPPVPPVATPTPGPTPTPTATPDGPGTPGPTPTATPAPQPTATPAPTPGVETPKPGTGAFASTKLKVSGKAKNQVRLALRCPASAATACSGQLRVRTKAKLKVGKRKAALVTVVGQRSYTVQRGKSATLTLTLSKDARSLFRTRKSLKVVVTLTAKAGSGGGKGKATFKEFTITK